ncbi:hypothetical protein ACIO13_22155 [Streptomyces sp. NPDC087425]
MNGVISIDGPALISDLGNEFTRFPDRVNRLPGCNVVPVGEPLSR